MPQTFSGFLACGAVNDGVFTEVAGAGYARQPVTFQADGSQLTNSASLLFGPAGADWPVFNGQAVYDALTSGNLLIWWVSSTQPRLVRAGRVHTVQSREIKLTGQSPSTSYGGPIYASGGLSWVAGLPVIGSTGATAPSSAVLIVNTYAASGAIAATDDLALVSAASGTLAMTLAAAAADKHQVVVKRYGAAVVTLTAKIDGAPTTLTLSSSAIKESVTLLWLASVSSWVLL